VVQRMYSAWCEAENCIACSPAQHPEPTTRREYTGYSNSLVHVTVKTWEPTQSRRLCRRPNRYLVPAVRNDLVRKMMFVAGPRQVGKTTLAKTLPSGVVGHCNRAMGADISRVSSTAVQPHSASW